MISHSLKLLFLHPPKTGGTSIESLLAKHEVGKSPRKMTKAQRNVYCLWTKDSSMHWSFDQYIDQFPFLSEWKSVATVRNPYSRIISEWKYQQRGKRNGSSVAHEKDDINLAIRSGSIKKCKWAYHWMPQARYIGPNTHVLHLENIDEEWKSLALNLGDVPHLNISRPKQEYVLDDQSKEIIQKEFPNDFEPFGYEK